MSAALALGFADPVLESQQAFRALMDALARPGTVQPFPIGLTPPAPLTPELAAAALTLADHDAPLWLDAALRAAPAVADYLRFHTGARIVDEPGDAAFALVADARCLPDFLTFAQGTPDYPDRSATILVAVERLGTEDGFRLEGPGIATQARLSAAPLPPDFGLRWAANRAAFPLGIDLILAAPGQVAGLPRSTRIVTEA